MENSELYLVTHPFIIRTFSKTCRAGAWLYIQGDIYYGSHVAFQDTFGYSACWCRMSGDAARGKTP